jgi:cell division protein FtsL
MAITRSKSQIKNESFFTKIRSAIFSSYGFPIIISLSFIAIMFVVFRMKSIELDYKITEVNKSIKMSDEENKELKAKRAQLMSIKNLTKLAKRYNLKEARQKQIIIIP